jgi:DNA-directed RNA polymerase subunit RPC12/RpoP
MSDSEMPVLKCLRCNHQWTTPSVLLPKVCPKCKSPHWDKERGFFKKLKKRKQQKEKEEYERAGELTELSHDLSGQGTVENDEE